MFRLKFGFVISMLVVGIVSTAISAAVLAAYSLQAYASEEYHSVVFLLGLAIVVGIWALILGIMAIVNLLYRILRELQDYNYQYAEEG